MHQGIAAEGDAGRPAAALLDVYAAQEGWRAP
jgi:hypothetical protein